MRAIADLRAAHESTPLAPLVGRKEELSLILDTLARARRDRTVQLVTLMGVPGIGKSRLVWELQRALEYDPGLVTWRRGRCLPYGEGVTFWALGEMVKAQAGILETDDAATAEAKLHRAVRDLVADPREAEWVEGHLRLLLALDAPAGERREEAFAAWRSLFEALSTWGPLVLVVEDLHWADDGLLDFLDHLADWATSAPLVLICTARPELRERRPTWGARANAVTIALAPLSDDETGALVGYLLRQTLVPAEFKETLLSRAEGNPLYAEEFVRMLVDRGFLYRNGGGWQLREGELPLPESVQGIIAARIDALQRDEKLVLQDAAVIGRGFWPDAVAAVGGVERAEVGHVLRSLEQKELVRRLGTSAVAGELQYSFRHALVRDVAYGQIPRAERTLRHLLAATWIESLGRREDHAETLAHHYLAAVEYADAGGQESSSFATRAQRALREAGDRALSLSAFATAARFFQGALDLWPEDDPERPIVLFCLGKALSRSSVPDEGVLEDARDALLAAGDIDRAAECDVIIGELLWRSGRREQAFERMNAGVERLKGRPASYSKAYALSTLSRFQIAADEAEEHDRPLGIVLGPEVERPFGRFALLSRTRSATTLDRRLRARLSALEWRKTSSLARRRRRTPLRRGSGGRASRHVLAAPERLDPGRREQVPDRSLGTRDLPIRNVTDECVAERVLELTRDGARAETPDEFFLLERPEDVPDLRAFDAADRGDRVRREAAADHGRILEHELFVPLQRVDPRRNDPLHRLGQRQLTFAQLPAPAVAVQEAAIDEHRTNSSAYSGFPSARESSVSLNSAASVWRSR